MAAFIKSRVGSAAWRATTIRISRPVSGPRRGCCRIVSASLRPSRIRPAVDGPGDVPPERRRLMISHRNTAMTIPPPRHNASILVAMGLLARSKLTGSGALSLDTTMTPGNGHRQAFRIFRARRAADGFDSPCDDRDRTDGHHRLGVIRNRSPGLEVLRFTNEAIIATNSNQPHGELVRPATAAHPL